MSNHVGVSIFLLRAEGMLCDAANSIGAALIGLRLRTEGVMAILGVKSDSSSRLLDALRLGLELNLENALLSIVSLQVFDIFNSAR